MSAQLELDLGPPPPAPLTRPETPYEKTMRLTNGTGRMPFHEALRLMYARVAERKAAGDWPPRGDR